ncbi:MAG: DUF177 domain-containing protein [Bdellovibrionales bacterium]
MKYNKSEFELSRLIKIDKIPRGGIEERIKARPKEREGLQKRFHLEALTRLEALINVDHTRKHMFEVKGRLWADVVMRCVVTLEPVPLTIEDSIDVLYAPPAMIASAEDMSELGDLDQPEPIENGGIDLGELVAQHLAMALPLYPRKEGVSFGEAEYHGDSDQAENPFVVLRDSIKDKEKTE